LVSAPRIGVWRRRGFEIAKSTLQQSFAQALASPGITEILFATLNRLTADVMGTCCSAVARRLLYFTVITQVRSVRQGQVILGNAGQKANHFGLGTYPNPTGCLN